MNKSKFNRSILISALMLISTLLFAVGAVCVFNNINTQNPSTNLEVQYSDVPIQDRDYSLSLDLGESKPQNKVQPLGANIGGDEEYIETNGNVKGGSYIQFVGTNLKFTLHDGTTKTVTASPENGKNVTGWEVWLGDEERFTVTIDGDGNITYSDKAIAVDYNHDNKFTMEEIDRYYSKRTIKIIAIQTDIEYSMKLYFDANDQAKYYYGDGEGGFTTTESYVTCIYKVSTETSLADVSVIESDLPSYATDEKAYIRENSVVGWVIRSDVQLSETCVISGSGYSVTFTIGEKLGTSNYYTVTAVQGYGTIPQSATNPVVVAYWKRTYNVEINLGDTVWTNASYSNGANDVGGVEYVLRNQDGSGNFTYSMAGIILNEDATNVGLQKNIKINQSCTALISNLNANTALSGGDVLNNYGQHSAASDDDQSVNIYNYGYKVSSWSVKFNGVATTIPNFDGLEDIATYLDNNYIGGLRPSVVSITPTWAPVEVTVKRNGSNSALKKVFYNSPYYMQEMTSKGSTFASYTYGDKFMVAGSSANQAIFNYTDLIVAENNTVLVDPVFKNNIYKVSLKGLDANKYLRIYDDLYTFNNVSQDDFDGSSVITWKDYYTMTSYADAGMVFSEDYSKYVLQNIDDLYSTNDDIIKNFNKVFIENSTITTGNKNADRANTGILPYMYVKDQSLDNQMPSSMPVISVGGLYSLYWSNKDSGEINRRYYATSNSSDSETDFETEQWLYADADIDDVSIYPLLEELKNAEYQIDLYYDLQGGTHYNTNSIKFKLYDAGEFSTELTPTNSQLVFAGWVFNKTLAENQNYEVSSSSDKLTVTSTTGDNWTFEIDGDKFTDTSGNEYYYVLSVSGYYDFVQNPSNPIVTASWHRTHEININLGNTVWTTGQYAGLSIGSKEANNNYKLAGIKSKLSSSSPETLGVTGKFKASFKQHSRIEESKISKNVEKAFTKETKLDMADGSSYAIYNYGYEIDSWRIVVEYNSKNKNVDFDNWCELVCYLDELYMTGENAITVTLTPTWKAVTVKAVLSEDSSVTKNITFNETYELDRSGFIVSSPLASGLSSDPICFTNNGNRVAKYARWNYTNLIYGYNEGYEVVLTPYYVNNIYKVNLDLADIAGFETYTIKSGSYLFATSNQKLDDYTKDTSNTEEIFTIAEFKDYLEYVTEEGGKVLVENYIADEVNTVIFEYERFMQPMHRKIYYTNGRSDNGTTWNGESNTQFYIYLANTKNIGVMPEFNLAGVEMLTWENCKADKVGSDYVLNSNYVLEIEEGSVSKKLYHYPTAIYDETRFNSQFADDDIVSTVSNFWNLSQGYLQLTGISNKFPVTLRPHVYREISTEDNSLKIKTVDENKALGLHGYAVVRIIDNSVSADSANYCGATYLVKYAGEMKAYKLGDSDYVFSSINNVRLPADSTYIKLAKGVEIIIEVYDQSKDYVAASSGYYDSMVGMRFANKSLTGYTLTAEDAKPYKYTLNSIVTSFPGANDYVEISFEKIKYSVNIKMSQGNRTHGTFTAKQNNTIKLNAQIYGNVEALSLGDTLNVHYNSFAGYELQATGFRFAKCQDAQLATDKDGNFIQDYNINFNSQWLREHYYSNNDTRYSVNNANLGQIIIYTQEMEFEMGVKIIGYDVRNDADYEIKTIENYYPDWKIGDEVSLQNMFTDCSSQGLGWVIEVDGIKYAAIQSYGWHALNSSNKGYLNTQYPFLLNNLSNETYTIDSDGVYNMSGTSAGVIIPTDARKLYMAIDVREIVVLTMEVEGLPYDTNNSIRTTILNTEQEMKIVAGAEMSGNLFKTTAGVYSLSMYSYTGKTNSLASTYDEKYYTGVEYYLGEELLTVQEFTLDGSQTVTIKYLPRLLNLGTVSFYLNNSLTTEQQLKNDGIFNSNFIVDPISNLYHVSDSNCSTITFTYSIADNFDIDKMIINEKEFGKINEYKVALSDYDIGAINLQVYVKEAPKNEINIKYALENNLQVTGSEDFGSITISGETYDGSQIVVYNGDSISFDMFINLGYEFSSIFKGINLYTKYTKVGNTINLINNFDSEVDAGTYTVYLKKTEVVAYLDVNSTTYFNINSGNKYGEYDESLTKVVLNGLYLGKSIQFIARDSDRQTLETFYYTDKDGVTHNVSGSMQITKDILPTLKVEGGKFIIEFAVKTMNKYNVKVEIADNTLVSGYTLSVNGTTEAENIKISNFTTQNYAVNSDIDFNVKSILSDKYTIDLIIKDVSGNVLNNKLDDGGNTVVENEKYYGQTELNVYDYKLTQDLIFVVVVNPNTYDQTQINYAYTSTNDLHNNTPTKINDTVSGSLFKSSVTIDIAVSKDIEVNGQTIETQIYKVIIEKEGGENLVYEISFDENDNIIIEGSDDAYALEIKSNDLLQLTYSIDDDLTIRLEYKAIYLVGADD